MEEVKKAEIDSGARDCRTAEADGAGEPGPPAGE